MSEAGSHVARGAASPGAAPSEGGGPAPGRQQGRYGGHSGGRPGNAALVERAPAAGERLALGGRVRPARWQPPAPGRGARGEC